eukprot:Colp12_sorted_trinity150504_noHs@13926
MKAPREPEMDQDMDEDEVEEPEEPTFSDEEPDDDEEMEVGEEGDAADEERDTVAYLPGQKLEEGEVLEHDESAYDMLHMVNVEWPCLSFDIITDGMGNGRTQFPMTAYMVAGTQADQPQNNKVMVMKMSNLVKTLVNEDDESDEESDDEGAGQPELNSKFVKHAGGVNRIRSCPQSPAIVATWADTGKVHVYDMTQHLAALDVDQHGALSPDKPVFTFSGHSTEGFALDWSRVVPGRLVTGDCNKFIYLWNRQEGGSWAVDKIPYNGHTASVEDVQFSPTEANVFASCSVDRTIRIWDARKKDGAAISVEAHESDVNVINWNKQVGYLMVSGGDDGVFKIWDLRNFKAGRASTPAAQFKWHSAPITSVEWHPTEDSVLAVSGADDQVSLWDMAVEKDEEAQASSEPQVPPQLLFIHQGQSDVKELHWHPQLPGVLVSTAHTGFNVFKTISV